MKRIKITDIPLKMQTLTHDGGEKELRLHYDNESFRWSTKTKKQYKAVEKEIDNISIKGNGWELYAWHDVSGFNYWMKQQEETNYLQITIAFEKKTVLLSELPEIQKALDKACAIARKIEDNNCFLG